MIMAEHARTTIADRFGSAEAAATRADQGQHAGQTGRALGVLPLIGATLQQPRGDPQTSVIMLAVPFPGMIVDKCCLGLCLVLVRGARGHGRLSPVAAAFTYTHSHKHTMPGRLGID